MNIEELNSMAETFDVKKASEEVAEWVCGNVESFIDNHNKEFSIGFSSKEADGLDELGKIEAAFDSLGISESGISQGDIKLAAECGLSKADQKRAEMLVGKFNDGEIVSADDLEEIKSLLSLAHKRDADPFAPTPTTETDRTSEINEEAEKLIILYNIIDKVKETLSTDKELLAKLYEKLIFYYELAGFRDGHKVERSLTGYVSIDEFEYFAYDIPIQATAKYPRVDEDGNAVLDDKGNVIIDIGETVTERIPPSFNLDISIDFWEQKPVSSLF